MSVWDQVKVKVGEAIDAKLAAWESARAALPRTGLDLEGNPALPIAGEVIDSPWGQSVVSRTVRRYSTIAIRNASLPNPDDGELSYIDELDQLNIYSSVAGKWKSYMWSTDADERFVNVDGDTMTGPLNMSGNLIAGVGTLAALGQLQIANDDGTTQFVLRGTGSSEGDIEFRHRTGGLIFQWNQSEGVWKVTYPLLAANGSAGAPGVAFTGDASIGIYRRSAGQLGLVAPSIYFINAANYPPTALPGNLYVATGSGLTHVSTATMLATRPGTLDALLDRTRAAHPDAVIPATVEAVTADGDPGLEVPEQLDAAAVIAHLLDRIEALEAGP